MSHRNTLRTHRRKWALSQADVAHLLGRARSAVSVYEAGAIIPNMRLVLAYQFIFGSALETLFPGLSKDVEEQVMRQAARLDAKFRDRTDATAAKVNEFLGEMASRALATDAA